MEVDDASLITFTIIALLALVVTYVFTGLSATKNTRLFKNTIGEVSAKYETEITPAGYTFGIWNLIFLWQAVWVLYAFISIWRTTNDGPILMNPDVIPIEFYLFWIGCCLFYVVWLFLWDRECLLYAFIDLLVLTGFGYASVAFLSVAVDKHQDTLNAKSDVDLTLVYVLVQNGTDLFFAWTTVATLLNLASALANDPLIKRNLSSKSASTLSLLILGIMVLLWAILENSVLFDYFQYVYAWYGVLIWALVGILVKNYDRTNYNSIFTILLLCIVLICLVTKVVVYASKKL